MKIVIQRVNRAHAHRPEETEVLAAIGEGLVLYVGIGRDDTAATVDKAATKVAHLRIFEEGESLFGRSLVDVGGEALVLFQMPMVADLSRGRRPNFSRAASPDLARELFDRFVSQLAEHGVRTTAGPFREHLLLHAENRGPFTVPLEV